PRTAAIKARMPAMEKKDLLFDFFFLPSCLRLAWAALVACLACLRAFLRVERVAFSARSPRSDAAETKRSLASSPRELNSAKARSMRSCADLVTAPACLRASEKPDSASSLKLFAFSLILEAASSKAEYACAAFSLRYLLNWPHNEDATFNACCAAMGFISV